MRTLATEADLLKVFTDLEDKAGLAFVFHVRDARGQRLDGLPDLIVVVPSGAGGTGRGGVIAFYELKTQTDRVTPRQQAIVDALNRCTRVESAIVRPTPRDGELSVLEALRRLGVEVW